MFLQEPIPDESRAILIRIAERVVQSVDLAIGIESAEAPFVPTVLIRDRNMTIPTRRPEKNMH